MNQTTIEKIQAERRRQIEKWGGGQFAGMMPERVLAVLTEEVGEVAQAILNLNRPPTDAQRRRREHLEAEIIQVAAVAARWLDECFTAEDGE